MVICLERGADLHMFQLMPLPLTVSCFSKIQIGFAFLVPPHPDSPGKMAVKRVCVCVCVSRRAFTTDGESARRCGDHCGAGEKAVMWQHRAGHTSQQIDEAAANALHVSPRPACRASVRPSVCLSVVCNNWKPYILHPYCAGAPDT